MNIQIGESTHIDGQIDNPEFYYKAMDIINKFHADHNRAMREIEDKIKQEEIDRQIKLKEANVGVEMITYIGLAIVAIWLLF